MTGAAQERAATPAWRRALPVLVVVALVGAVFAFGLNNYLSFEALRQNREALLGWVAENRVSAPLVFLAAYTAAVALSIPGAVWLTLAAGFLFGPWLGGTLATIAATVGATIIFLIARTAAGDVLRRRAGPWVARMADGFDRNALSYMLLLRMVPIFPFWLVNIVPGVLGVRPAIYIVATLVGILPATFVYAGIGSGLGEVFARGETPDLSIVLEPRFLLPLLGLVLLAMIPLAYRRWKGDGVAL
jgi:uncharacterized membrane protein YdjX (TVP38/TMEM64 family)